MPAVTLRRATGLALLIFAAILLAWGVWPLPVQTHTVVIPLSDMQPTAGSEAAAGKEGPGRALVLDWPGTVRTGEVFSVRMALLPPDSTEAESAGLTASPALVEARLELPGMDTAPPGETSQALASAHLVQFSWQARADRSGVYSGTVWLHLQPAAGTRRKILGAPRIEIRARSFLGLTGPWARGLGSAGIVLGVVFGLDAIAAGWGRRILRKQDG